MASDWLTAVLPANLKPCWKIVVEQHGLHGELVSLDPLVNMWFYLTLLQTHMMHTFEYLPHSSQYNMVGSHLKKAQYFWYHTFCCCLYRCCLGFFLLFLVFVCFVDCSKWYHSVYQFPCLWIIGRLSDPIFYKRGGKSKNEFKTTLKKGGLNSTILKKKGRQNSTAGWQTPHNRFPPLRGPVVWWFLSAESLIDVLLCKCPTAHQTQQISINSYKSSSCVSDKTCTIQPPQY